MSTTVYTWNPLTDSVIEESDGSGNSLCTYTNEPSQFGPLISDNRNGVTSYYHADAIGSTRLTTNNSQSVVDSFLFDAWGATVASSQPTTLPYQWCGRWGYQADASTGTTFVRERSYQPATGRWSSIDPLYTGRATSFIPAIAPYVYGSNCTPCNVDPTGFLDMYLRSDSVGGEDLTYYYVNSAGQRVSGSTTLGSQINAMYSSTGGSTYSTSYWDIAFRPSQMDASLRYSYYTSWTVGITSATAAALLSGAAYTGVSSVGNIVIPGTQSLSLFGPILRNPAILLDPPVLPPTTGFYNGIWSNTLTWHSQSYSSTFLNLSRTELAALGEGASPAALNTSISAAWAHAAVEAGHPITVLVTPANFAAGDLFLTELPILARAAPYLTQNWYMQQAGGIFMHMAQPLAAPLL